MRIDYKPITRNPYFNLPNITVKGGVLHSIGCAQPSASVLVSNYDRPGCGASIHAFIDANTGDVIQTLPWNRKAYHSAYGKNGRADSTRFGIEMCEPPCIKYTGGATFACSDKKKAREYVDRTYKSAVELFAMLCKKYNLDPMKDGVIMSHNEASRRGLAGGHVDPEHLWKGVGASYTMDGFRKDVKAKMQESSTQSSGSAPAETKKEENPAISEPSTFRPYIGKVTADVLNVRKSAGITTKIVMTIKKGEAYTIVAEKKANGIVWGQLKSGAGWVSTEYLKKVRYVK